jgi:hypothetical protein
MIRAIGGFLFEIRPPDPTVYAGSPLCSVSPG